MFFVSIIILFASGTVITRKRLIRGQKVLPARHPVRVASLRLPVYYVEEAFVSCL